MKNLILSVLAFSVLVPTFAFASFDTNLKYGSHGSAVTELQTFLHDQGVYSGTINGNFGVSTRNAVIAFQTAHGLHGDGYFGASSRMTANALIAVAVKPSPNAVQAQTITITPTTASIPGCTSTSLYSTITGHPCSATTPPVVTQSQPQIIPQIIQTTTPTSTVVSNPNPLLPQVDPTALPATTTYDIQPQAGSPLQPRTGLTEQQLRDYAADMNPQQSWKVACENNPIQSVITAMVGNGFVITTH